jgi:hypothetical protein
MQVCGMVTLLMSLTKINMVLGSKNKKKNKQGNTAIWIESNSSLFMKTRVSINSIFSINDNYSIEA